MLLVSARAVARVVARVIDKSDRFGIEFIAAGTVTDRVRQCTARADNLQACARVSGTNSFGFFLIVL